VRGVDQKHEKRGHAQRSGMVLRGNKSVVDSWGLGTVTQFEEETEAICKLSQRLMGGMTRGRRKRTGWVAACEKSLSMSQSYECP